MVSPDAGRVKERFPVRQSKTRNPVRFEITETTRQSVRIMRERVLSIGLEPAAYGTHSLCRRKVAQIRMWTGPLRAVRLLLGHPKMDRPLRCLGVDQDDVLPVSDGIDRHGLRGRTALTAHPASSGLHLELMRGPEPPAHSDRGSGRTAEL